MTATKTQEQDENENLLANMLDVNNPKHWCKNCGQPEDEHDTIDYPCSDFQPCKYICQILNAVRRKDSLIQVSSKENCVELTPAEIELLKARLTSNCVSYEKERIRIDLLKKIEGLS